MSPMHDAEPLDQETPDDPDEAAALWFLRLREPDAPAEPSQAFERWRAADPRHAEAYARTERLWRHLEMPAVAICRRQDSQTEAARPARRRVGRWAAGLAAAVAVLAVVGAWSLGWTGMAVARLQADHATAVGARTAIALADGSHVVLDSDSAIAVAFSATERQVTLLRGRARFEVRRDTARPFRVETPTGTVTVTGTVFDVRLAETSALVSLEEGRVEMRAEADPAGTPTVLAPGQEARLDPDGVSRPRRFDRTVQRAWLKDQIVFSGAPLSSVVAELDRYYPGRIVIADSSLAAKTLSGAFSTRTPVRALEAIGDIVPARVSVLSDLLIVLH